jgi:hypothetical protein
MNLLRVFAAILLGFPAVASAATRVSSDSNCPSSDAVSVRLLGLLPAGGPENASARVHVDAQSMLIEVTTPGEPARQRTVPLAPDCEERTEMAALIIASWLDAMPVGTVGTPGIPVTQAPAAAPSGTTESGGSPSPEPPWDGGRILAGAGLLGMADKQTVSPGLVLCASMPELIANFGLALEASVGLYRDVTVGAGTARYWRPTVALQASADLYRSRWLLRAVAGPALGILTVSGSGYEKSSTETTVMWGADLGLVLALAGQHREAWISVAAMTWPQGRGIRSKPEGPGSQVGLPEWEARLSVGFSWEIRGSAK